MDFSDETEWFYLDNNAENTGPFTATELAGFWKEGAVSSLNERVV